MSFDPISAGLDFAGKVVDRIWPDATEKQKAEAAQIIAELAHEETMFKAAVEDRSSARDRESAVVSSSEAPRLNKLVTPVLALGTVSVALLLIVLFQTGLIDPSRKDLAIYILGALTTAVTQVLSYYFGSSDGSAKKNVLLQDMIDK
jgi:hypothetical protein